MVSDLNSQRYALRRTGLNPCSNGIWSLTLNWEAEAIAISRS